MFCVQTILGLDYGFISPPSTEISSEITSEEINSIAENVVQINVYFDTLSEKMIESKATYKVCEIWTTFQNKISF